MPTQSLTPSQAGVQITRDGHSWSFDNGQYFEDILNQTPVATPLWGALSFGFRADGDVPDFFSERYPRPASPSSTPIR